MESPTLPPGYSVHLATEQDTQNKSNSIKSFIIRFIFGLLLVIVLSNTLFRHNWERAQLVFEFENGRRSQSYNFGDWLKITWVSLEPVLISLAPIFGLGHLIYRSMASFFQKSLEKQERWVAVYKNQIIGRATIRLEENYSILMLVSINPGHWWQGIGSSLVWNSIKDVKKPIYLTCYPRLQNFYSRFGFVTVTERNIPPDFRKYNLGCVMALLDAPTLPTERKESVFPLPETFSIYSIENMTERWLVYQKLWSRQSFKQSRLYIFAFIVTIFAAEIPILILIWRIGKVLSGYFLGLHSLAIIICLFILSAPIFTILIWWQEWIVEEGVDVIAYAHLSCRREYSILYCLYVEPKFQPKNIGQAFLERLTKRLQLPIYLICPHHKVQFYSHLGFVPTDMENLPFELRILRLGNYVALMKT